MKKKLCLFLTLILSISILSGCGQDTQEASGDTNQPAETAASKPAADAESDSSQNAAPAENSSFTPAADIELPLGKKAYALPVDQAAVVFNDKHHPFLSQSNRIQRFKYFIFIHIHP